MIRTDQAAAAHASPPRWSKFPITSPCGKLYADFSVEVETEHLSMNQIPDAHQERHDIILSLYWHGYTPTKIAHYLNRIGMKTPRGKTYYPKLVSVITPARLRLGANTPATMRKYPTQTRNPP